MNLNLTQILKRVDGSLLSGDSERVVHGFASLLEAEAGDLSLFSNNRYRAQLLQTRAGIVLMPKIKMIRNSFLRTHGGRGRISIAR